MGSFMKYLVVSRGLFASDITKIYYVLNFKERGKKSVIRRKDLA